MDDDFETDQMFSLGELEDLINQEMGELNMLTNAVDQNKYKNDNQQKPSNDLKFKNKSSAKKTDSSNKENIAVKMQPNQKYGYSNNLTNIPTTSAKKFASVNKTPTKNSFVKNPPNFSSNNKNSTKKDSDKPKDQLKSPYQQSAITGRTANSLKCLEDQESFYNLNLSQFQSNTDFPLGKAQKFQENNTSYKKKESDDEDDLFSRLNKISQINSVSVEETDEKTNHDETYNKLKNMIDSHKENQAKNQPKKSIVKDTSQKKINHGENFKKKNTQREKSLSDSDTKFMSNVKTSKRKPSITAQRNEKSSSTAQRNEDGSQSRRSVVKDNTAAKYGSIKYLREVKKNQPKVLLVNKKKLLKPQVKSKQIDIECDLEVDESYQQDYLQTEEDQYIQEIEKPNQNVSEIEIKHDTYTSEKSYLTENSYDEDLEDQSMNRQNYATYSHRVQEQELINFQEQESKIQDAEDFLKSKLMAMKKKEPKNFLEKNKRNITPKKSSISMVNSKNDSQLMKSKSPIKWEPRVHKKKVEVEEHSFRPMLSKNSMMIAENLPNNRERLYQCKKNNSSGKKHQQEITEDCTFQPKINNMSKYIDRKVNDDDKSRCEQLHQMKDYYNARKDLRLEQKKYNEEIEMQNCTFKPIQTKQANYQAHYSVGSDIASRTQQWQKKKEEKILMAKKFKEETENDNSYAPKTNKNYEKNNELDYYSSSFMQQGLMEHFQRIEKAKKEKEDKENRLLGKKRNNGNASNITPSKASNTGRTTTQSQRGNNNSSMHYNDSKVELNVETVRRLQYEFNNAQM